MSSTSTARHDGHRVRRSPRSATVAALAAGVLLLGAACTDEQRRALGEEDVRASLAARVSAAVEADGSELEGDLDCQATIGDDGVVTAGCTGTTTTGDAVSGAYAGTADVDAETCAADVVATIADEPVMGETGVECFDAG